MTVAEAAAIIAADQGSSGITPQGIITLALIAAVIWAAKRPPKEARTKKPKKSPAPEGLPADLAPFALPTGPAGPAVPPRPEAPPSVPQGPAEAVSGGSRTEAAPFWDEGLEAPAVADHGPEPEGSAFPFADLRSLPNGLGEKLQRDRWNKMIQERGLNGLTLNYVEETPFGVDIHVVFLGATNLKDVQNKLHQIETGLDFDKAWKSQIKPGISTQNGIIRIITRDPIEEFPWEEPAGPVRLADPLWISRNAFGEDVTISVKQRIGIFGTSGSGKSCAERIVGAHVIQAVDADLEIWDLKFGMESQHYEGKAQRFTTVDAARSRVNWLINVEFPRRAAVMLEQRTSSWEESPENPARVVMIDEGNSLIRNFTRDDLKKLYQAVEQGRALGVYFVWATQFPKADNLPTEIRSQLNCRISLLLLSSEESQVVFKDDVNSGWSPHRLIGPGWMLIKDADHRTPDESKARWLSPDAFRNLSAPDLVPDIEPEAVSVSESAPRTVVDEIWEALLLSEDALGVSELARKLGRSKSTVSEALGRMERDGSVCRTGTASRPLFELPLSEEY